MDRYPPLAEHGLVGDLQTAALVSAQGVVDWFAAPRFDSPSIFAALLDHDGGGYLRPAPERPEALCKQLYYPDTAVPVTRFMSPDGVGEVVDLMRRAPGTDAHLRTTFPLERDGQDPRGRVTLSAGESGGAVFTVCASGGEAPAPLTVEGLTAQADETGLVARAGRLSRARYTFEKMQTYANHVGLFAEEVGPSGEQPGDFPRAFTRLSLIMAAATLDRALDAERGR